MVGGVVCAALVLAAVVVGAFLKIRAKNVTNVDQDDEQLIIETPPEF